MGRLEGQHEISTIGQAKTVATGAAAASQQLVVNPKATGPVTFIVWCTQDVRVRQGSSTVTATSLDPLLFSRSYAKITVTSHKNNYLSYIRDSTNGSLQYWQANSEDPGTGASS